MFTGIIKEIGKVERVIDNREGREFEISSKGLIKELVVDDSISVNGVCQTVIQTNGSNLFKIQAVHVTLSKTNFGQIKCGDLVNLELALRPLDRMGGHFVQGHVNGIGKLLAMENKGKNIEIKVKIPNELSKYIVKEGSIAIDGISLTVADKIGETILLSIIPHTVERTSLKIRKIGDNLNIEIDILAKYLESLFSPKSIDTDLNIAWIKSKGF
jgi:riboflavin synthase